VSSKFFTNTEGNTLFKKFEGVHIHNSHTIHAKFYILLPKEHSEYTDGWLRQATLLPWCSTQHKCDRFL